MNAYDIIEANGAMISEIIALGMERFVLNPFGIHGISHWHRVLSNSIEICLQDKVEIDRRIIHALTLFAMLHDCERDDDDADPEHGHKAAEVFESLHYRYADIMGDELIDTVTYAIRWHSSGRISDNYLTQVMWASDRLDLVRVGVTPSHRLLALPGAIAIAQRRCL